MISALGLTLFTACAAEAPEPVIVEPPPARTPEPAETPTATSIELEPIADGFDQPLFVTGAGDGSGRLFVVEKTGRVWIVRGGQRSERPFLDLSGKVSTSSEQGLLGLAFAPDFATSGEFYIDYTDRSGATVVSRLRASGNEADPESEAVLLRFPQPYANHNGGMIAFGPDGYLYIGTGDGGGGGDPERAGQDLGTYLGKLLRIDVSGGSSGYATPPDNPFLGTPGALPEIWAYGLRNPWRFSFDRASGDLWIGDVGQSALEEIDFQPAASTGGENYGWSLYEGTRPYPPGSAAADGAFVTPIVEYGREAGKSVTGGHVYRGSAQPGLVGMYVYGDFVDGRVWGLVRGNDGSATNRLLTETGHAIASFGEDDAGELYLVDFGGSILRVVAR